MYAVVATEGGKTRVSDVFEDMGEALDLAARLKADGKRPRVFQEIDGEVVLTAKIVKNAPTTNGHSNVHPIRQAAVVREPGVKRSSGDLEKLRVKILSWVSTNKDKGVEEMARALSVPTKDLVLPIRQLCEEGKIKKRGQARAVKYRSAGVPTKAKKAA